MFSSSTGPLTSYRKRCTSLFLLLTRLTLQAAFKALYKFWERNAQCVAERAQLNDIETPLPSLALADERLRFADAGGELDLREAASLPGGTKLAQEDSVFS